MKKCTKCQSDIDDKATKCPHCQSDQKTTSSLLGGVISLIIIGGVIWAVFGNGGSKSPTQPTSQPSTASGNQSPTVQPTTAVQKPTIVEATALIADYDKNKLAANDKYKGKLVQTTGYIKNISDDLTGKYYLSLEPTNDQYYFGTTMACYFNDKSELTSLANGQSVTVQGTMEEMTVGIIAMKDCKVVK